MGLLKGNTQITSFLEVDHFHNLLKLDLSGCTRLQGELPLSGLNKLQEVSVAGSAATLSLPGVASLTKVAYGTPLSIVLPQGTGVDSTGLTYDSLSNLTKLHLANLHDTKSFLKLISMLSLATNKLIDIKVELQGVEGVDYLKIESLKQLLSNLSSQANTTLTGTLSSSYAYKDTIDALNISHPGLTINYTTRLLRWLQNQPLLSYLLDQFDTNSDGAIGLDELAGITSLSLPDGVTHLKESDEFPNTLSLMTGLLNITDGSGLAGTIDVSNNTDIRTIDVSNGQVEKVDGLNNKSYLTKLKYNTPKDITISNCLNVRIYNISGVSTSPTNTETENE